MLTKCALHHIQLSSLFFALQPFTCRLCNRTFCKVFCTSILQREVRLKEKLYRCSIQTMSTLRFFNFDEISLFFPFKYRQTTSSKCFVIIPTEHWSRKVISTAYFNEHRFSPRNPTDDDLSRTVDSSALTLSSATRPLKEICLRLVYRNNSSHRFIVLTFSSLSMPLNCSTNNDIQTDETSAVSSLCNSEKQTFPSSDGQRLVFNKICLRRMENCRAPAFVAFMFFVEHFFMRNSWKQSESSLHIESMKDEKKHLMKLNEVRPVHHRRFEFAKEEFQSVDVWPEDRRLILSFVR